jgi:hypothetical protein
MSTPWAASARKRRLASRTVRHSSAGGINRKAARIDPKPYLADILTKLVNGWPMAKIDESLPWAWAQQNKVSLAD